MSSGLHLQRIFEFKDPHLFPVCILYLRWMLFDLSFGSTSLNMVYAIWYFQGTSLHRENGNRNVSAFNKCITAGKLN